jgi:hypothetical protein
MDNKMKLLNWNLSIGGIKNNKYVFAWGVLKGNHPKIPNGEYIHTSEIININIIDNKFLAKTYSGSLYELDFNEINLNYKETNIDALKILLKNNYDEKMINKIIEDKINKNIQEENNLIENLSDNYLYIEMSGDYFIKGYFKHNKKLMPCHAYTHVGTFVDSVLISAEDKVDFRYFPKGNSIEIYHWSNGLEAIVINNISEEDLIVYGTTKTLIETNSSKIIQKKDGDKEGLFSPDKVNGKCLLK